MKRINLLQKVFITLALALAVYVLPSSLSANASELVTPPQQGTQGEISPFWVYDYVETVKVSYNSATEIPDNYHYEYYHNIYGTMRGVLKYQSHTISKGKYVATFTGRMYSNPL